jgi:enoyl-[acyl-carrier protein] reductase II
MDIAKQLHLPYIKLFIGILASGWGNAKQLAFMANAFKAIRIATENGDLAQGVLPVGQVTGLLKDIPTVAEAIERTVKEAEEIAAELAKKAGIAAPGLKASSKPKSSVGHKPSSKTKQK